MNKDIIQINLIQLELIKVCN